MVHHRFVYGGISDVSRVSHSDSFFSCFRHRSARLGDPSSHVPSGPTGLYQRKATQSYVDCPQDRLFEPSRTGATGFTDVTDAVGLDFEHVVGPLGTYFLPEAIGAGGALADFDGDGRLDVFLVNCGRSPDALEQFPAGTRVENRLFLQTEAGTLVDVTENSGLGDLGYGVGCAVGDVDNDGDLDVYVTNYGATVPTGCTATTATPRS